MQAPWRDKVRRTKDKGPRMKQLGSCLVLGPLCLVLRQLGAAGDLGGNRHVQVRQVHPATGVGCAMPTLQGDRADVVALLVVEDFKEGAGEAGPDLRRGAAKIEQPVAAVV